MAPPASIQRTTCRALLLALACTSCSAGAPVERLVRIEIGGVPLDALSVEVLPILGGAGAGAPLRFDALGPEQLRRTELRLELRLKPEPAAELSVAVGARDAQGCLLATGEAALQLAAGAGSYPLPIILARLAQQDPACAPGTAIITAASVSGETTPGLIKARGGQEITVRGYGFLPGAALTIGGKPAIKPTFRSPLEVTAAAPALSRWGPVELSIMNPGASQAAARADLLTSYSAQVRFTRMSAPFQVAPDGELTGTFAHLDSNGRPEVVGYHARHPQEPDPPEHKLIVALHSNALDPPYTSGSVFHFPLQAAPKKGSPASIATSDLNGDGATDVVLGIRSDLGAGVTADEIVVFRNTGSGAGIFPMDGGTRYAAPALISDVSVGDVSEDGKPDVVAVTADFSVLVYINEGNGTFKPPTVHVAPLPGPGASGLSALALVDLDGDGRLDVAAVSAVAPYLAVLLNQGKGRFPGGASTYPCKLPRSLVRAADLDRDGRPDLVLANRGMPTVEHQTLVLLRNQGLGHFTRVELLRLSAQASALAIGDVNGDGWPDLLVRSSIMGGRLGVLLGNRRGGFDEEHFYEDIGAPLIMDLNMDGFPDIAGLVSASAEGVRAASLLSRGDKGDMP